jgi:hypothetical protein
MLQEYLITKEISTGIHSPIAPEFTCIQKHGEKENNFPVATTASQEILSFQCSLNCGKKK